jgi:deoxyribodipyrimidine photo-lyase
MTESVFDLQDSLKKIQSDLHLAFGQPEKVVPHIVDELKKEGMNVSEVWLAREVTAEEITTEKRLAKALKQSSSSLRMITGR